MMANPNAVFLDESSAGVDPFSRRKLWGTIDEESKDSAVIVTTHSMEEAEALGTKMAIMVAGQFKCFGTAQQIKNKYGRGYTIEVKFDLEKIYRKFSDFSQKLKDDNLDTIKLTAADNSQKNLQRRLSRRNSLKAKDNVSKVESAFAEWRRIYQSEFKVNDMPNLISDKEFKEDGLLSSYYKKFASE